jgi:hypothetical protein
MQLSSLRDEDIDPRNLDRGEPHINNFIFIPAEKAPTSNVGGNSCRVKNSQTVQVDEAEF